VGLIFVYAACARGARPLAANTLAELIALGQGAAGQAHLRVVRAGGAIHLASELFKREAGVDIVHVPIEAADGGDGLAHGRRRYFHHDASTTVENIRAGKLRRWQWLGQSARALPQVPTSPSLDARGRVVPRGSG